MPDFLINKKSKNPANGFFSGNGNCFIFPLIFESLQRFKENIEADNHSLRVSADKSIDPFPRIPDKSGPHALVYNAILKELV